MVGRLNMPRRQRPFFDGFTVADINEDTAVVIIEERGIKEPLLAKHLDTPVILISHDSVEGTLPECRPAWPYYLGSETSPIAEAIGLSMVTFAGLWQFPFTALTREDKSDTGEGKPFSDGGFHYRDKTYNVEVVRAYPKYKQGHPFMSVYGQATNAPQGRWPPLCPYIKCLTCGKSGSIYVPSTEHRVPHPDDHTWICWFPVDWLKIGFPGQKIVKLSPIAISPESLRRAVSEAIATKCENAKALGLGESDAPTLLVVIAQGFPVPESIEWLKDLPEGASQFAMTLLVIIDGYIGTMENDSFSYQITGTFTRCPDCDDFSTHKHSSVFATVRHRFDQSGGWEIYGTQDGSQAAKMRGQSACDSMGVDKQVTEQDIKVCCN